MKNEDLEKSINNVADTDRFSLEYPTIVELKNTNEQLKEKLDNQINQFPANIWVALTHNRAMKMGLREYSDEKCPCCETKIPSKNFKVAWKYKKRKMLEYGLDCGLYFYISKFYFLLLYAFLITSLLYIFVFTLINQGNFLTNILQNYRKAAENPKPESSLRNLQSNQYNLFTTILDLLKSIFSIKTKFSFWQLVNTGIITAFYFYTNYSFDLFLKKILVKYASHFVDESHYSVLVKNLPLYTDKDDFMQFIRERYHTKEIIDVFMIPSLNEIKLKYKRLKELAHSGKMALLSGAKFDEKKFVNCKNNLLKHVWFNKFSGTAIILFDDPDDAKMFLRPEFDKEKRHISYYKKPDYYRGNLIYFSALPAIGNIKWINLEYYRTEGFLKIATLSIVFFCLTFIFFFIYGLIIEIDTLFTPPLLLFVIGELIAQIIKLLIKIVGFDDAYFENVLCSYLSTQKTTIMILFMSSSFSKFTFENISESNKVFVYNFFIYFGLFLLKAFITAKFNYSYILRKIKLLWHLILRKKLIQYQLNELYLDNEFDIVENFENFRVLVYIAVISSLYSFAFSAFMTLVVFVFYFFSNYALFTSNYSNISYFQNYFFYIYYLDFFNLTMIYAIKWFLTILFDSDPYIAIIIYFALDTTKDFFVSITIKDQFFFKKSYKQVNHCIEKKLEKEKYVNIKKLEEDVLKINLEVLFKDQ